MKFGSGDVRRALGHVGVLAGGERLEEAHDAPEARGRHAGEPERGTAAAARQPLLVIPAHLRGLHRRILRHAGGRRDRGGLRRAPAGWSPGSASSGKSRRTGPAGSSSRSSAARSTRCWSAGSFGRPSAWPNGNGTKSARGGFTFSVCSRTMLIDVVAMPSASSARASTPPVCVQKGQVGVIERDVHALVAQAPADLGPGLALDARERRAARP